MLELTCCPPDQSCRSRGATCILLPFPAFTLLVFMLVWLATCSVYMDGAAEPGEPGYGPLRAWPGGLCVSRAIGDMDVGECILAHPHIMQIQIPPEGARLVMASDGLWDCFPTRKVVKMARTKETQPAGMHAPPLQHPCTTPAVPLHHPLPHPYPCYNPNLSVL